MAYVRRAGLKGVVTVHVVHEAECPYERNPTRGLDLCTCKQLTICVGEEFNGPDDQVAQIFSTDNPEAGWEPVSG